ncbi:hypothetical protein DPQ22_09300 [Candidatus Tokpelaia sp.]|nr:hypothetical protein DPQ22_09300 [Candidatus Tokpelaia sp.]
MSLARVFSSFATKFTGFSALLGRTRRILRQRRLKKQEIKQNTAPAAKNKKEERAKSSKSQRLRKSREMDPERSCGLGIAAAGFSDFSAPGGRFWRCGGAFAALVLLLLRL